MRARIFFTVHHSKDPLDYTCGKYLLGPVNDLSDQQIETHVRLILSRQDWPINRITIDEIERLK